MLVKLKLAILPQIFGNLGIEGAHLYRVEIDEHITKLFQQKETGSHTLSAWDCVCQIVKTQMVTKNIYLV